MGHEQRQSVTPLEYPAFKKGDEAGYGMHFRNPPDNAHINRTQPPVQAAPQVRGPDVDFQRMLMESVSMMMQPGFQAKKDNALLRQKGQEYLQGFAQSTLDNTSDLNFVKDVPQHPMGSILQGQFNQNWYPWMAFPRKKVGGPFVPELLSSREIQMFGETAEDVKGESIGHEVVHDYLDVWGTDDPSLMIEGGDNELATMLITAMLSSGQAKGDAIPNFESGYYADVYNQDDGNPWYDFWSDRKTETVDVYQLDWDVATAAPVLMELYNANTGKNESFNMTEMADYYGASHPIWNPDTPRKASNPTSPRVHAIIDKLEMIGKAERKKRGTQPVSDYIAEKTGGR